MIHIDNKFVVSGDFIADFVTSVYGDINVNYADRDYVSTYLPTVQVAIWLFCTGNYYICTGI